jgi:hypothetical protein
MTSVAVREMRAELMYEAYRAEHSDHRVVWSNVGRTMQVKWERIASRYHEKVDGICPHCDGSGNDPAWEHVPCPQCSGSGKVR